MEPCLRGLPSTSSHTLMRGSGCVSGHDLAVGVLLPGVCWTVLAGDTLIYELPSALSSEKQVCWSVPLDPSVGWIKIVLEMEFGAGLAQVFGGSSTDFERPTECLDRSERNKDFSRLNVLKYAAAIFEQNKWSLSDYQVSVRWESRSQRSVTMC